MSEPTPLSAEELNTFLALHSPVATDDGFTCFQDAEVWPCLGWRVIGEHAAQATEIAALKGALEAKEREMLAEHSSAMQALLRWCAEDTPEDIRKGWEQESHEALRALAAGRPR